MIEVFLLEFELLHGWYNGVISVVIQIEICLTLKV